jgi:hypothetical protein
MVAFAIVLGALVAAHAGASNNISTGIQYSYTQKPKSESVDTTRYPVEDRYGDPYTYPNKNTFDLKDTGFIKRTIEYDPKTKQYYVVEKLATDIIEHLQLLVWMSF